MAVLRMMLAPILIFAAIVYAERTNLLPAETRQLLEQPEVRQIVERIEREVRTVLADLPLHWPPSVGSSPHFDFVETAALLDQIRVEPEHRRGYDREAWPHWNDADGDCLHAREEVLVAESVDNAKLSADGCSVRSGLWHDIYTGETFRNPSDLDVDHVVALQEAHDSGGWNWSRTRRAAFANDLEDPRTLVAVSAAANRSKAAYGPEEWLPPDPSSHCTYVADWIAVKARWGLTMDESERVAVGNILNDCQQRDRLS